MRGLLSAGRANGVRASDQSAGGGTMIDLSNPEHVQYLREGGMSSAGASVNERTAMRIAAAWRCVHIIAGGPGNTPLELMERVDDKKRRVATEHPTRQLLAVKPNGWQTPQDFKRMMTAHVALRGNGCAYKLRGLNGRVQELWPLHPDRVEPKQDPATMAMSYEVTGVSGARRTFTADEIFHVRGLSLDGVTGLGALAFARDNMGMAIQGQRAAAKMWKQGAMVGGVLEHPGELSDEAFDRLKTSLAEHQSGVDNAGKWLIAEEGMKVADVFLSAADMQFLESRQFEVRQIAMFFGVPPHMLGDTEKSTSWGTGIEAQTTGFMAYTLEDYLTAWEETGRRDLLTPAEAEKFYLRFTRAAIVRSDLKTRNESYARALQWGWLNPDEVRALEDMNPRADGEGGKYYDPPNTAGDPGSGPDKSGAEDKAQ